MGATHTHTHTQTRSRTQAWARKQAEQGNGDKESLGGPHTAAPTVSPLSVPSLTAATETSTTRRAAGAPTSRTSWRRTRRSSTLRCSWRTGAGGGPAAHPTAPSRSVAQGHQLPPRGLEPPFPVPPLGLWAALDGLALLWGNRAFGSAYSSLLSLCSETPPTSCPALGPKVREEGLGRVWYPRGAQVCARN